MGFPPESLGQWRVSEEVPLSRVDWLSAGVTVAIGPYVSRYPAWSVHVAAEVSQRMRKSTKPLNAEVQKWPHATSATSYSSK